MTGSVNLDEHAREAEVAFKFRTGRPAQREQTGPWMLSMSTPAAEGQGAVSYTFLPHAHGEHMASLSIEIGEAPPLELRPGGWASSVLNGSQWHALRVLDVPIIVHDPTVDARLLEADLNAHRVGLGELRVARIDEGVFRAEFVSPRPRSPSVIFERVEELLASITRARAQTVGQPRPPGRGPRVFSDEEWTFVRDRLDPVTAPFSGVVSQAAESARVVVSLAGHVDEALTGEVEIVPGTKIEARLATPPLPTTVRLAPQQGVLGFFRSLREHTLGDPALDDAFLVHLENDALSEFLLAQAPPLLRLRDVGLQLDLAEGWMSVSGLKVSAAQAGDVLADLLELWRTLCLELVGLRG